MRGIRVIVSSIVLISVASTVLFISSPGRHGQDSVRQLASQTQLGHVPSAGLDSETSCLYPEGRILIIENRLEATRVVEPNYPNKAKLLHVEGPVEVTALVDENGDVIWACGKGHPALTSAAEEAARQFKFAKYFGAVEPWIAGRTPVVLYFDFRLNGGQQASADEFLWKVHGNPIGRLDVPPGFKAETYDYREGVVTTLRYEDGASITLQSGGMFRIPLFQGSRYVLVSSTDLDTKTVRSGRSAKGNLYWREDNYIPKKISGPRISPLALVPPNLGYSEVSALRRSEFDHALDSFVREIDRIQATSE